MHSNHCELLKLPGATPADITYFSSKFGEAALNSLKYFSVSSGTLVPDLMHDILEGALPLEVKLMLKVKGILL